VARLAAGVRRLEEHPSPLLPLAGKGVWEHLFAIVAGDPDFEWLMIDSTHAKAHRHACGAKGGNEAIGRVKGG